MADERVGFVIEDRFYAFPTSFRLADPVLVEELTGLGWDEFVDRLPGEDQADGQGSDPIALVGLVGVAVWQQNPRWRRDRVVRFIEQIRQDQIEFQAPEPEEANGSPPAQTAGGTPSGPSASSSDSGSEKTSTTSSRDLSGQPTSPTSPEEQSE